MTEKPTPVEPTPKNRHRIDVERPADFDQSIDYTVRTTNRRTLGEYFFFDFPMSLIRFSYFRSNQSVTTQAD